MSGKKETYKLFNLPWYYFAIFAVLVLIATYTGTLPKGMSGCFAFMIVLGTILYEIGEKTPIIRSYLGGGAIVVLFGTALLNYFNLLPALTETLEDGTKVYNMACNFGLVGNITSFFQPTGAFLDFYIAALITGSILGMNSTLLKKAATRYFPAIFGGLILSFALCMGTAAIMGYGTIKALLLIALPIMGGGMGAGAVPLSKIFESSNTMTAAEAISVMTPAVAIGNAISIVLAGIIVKVIASKSWNGQGALMQAGTVDPKELEISPEMQAKRDKIDVKNLGIGLFVSFVGLQNAKLIVNNDSTLVTYQHFKGETFHSVGMGAILALLGVIITAILLAKKVKGGILYGILITWLLGIVCELTGIYVPDVEAGMFSVIPTAFVSFDFSALGQTFGQVFKTDFSGVSLLNFFAVIFSFLFVDLFDTLGTLIGVASKADMLDEEGRLPRIKGALMADSIGTCVGAVLGTSTTTTFVESASGVTEGGRTGLTAMTTGVLFLLATIFSPLFLTIPSFATAPALIIVGFYMMGSAVKIDFNDPSEGIPAFLTILAMPTAYSISEGIAIGIISWTIINVVTGKAKEKKISPLMYVLTVLFILKYIFL